MLTLATRTIGTIHVTAHVTATVVIMAAVLAIDTGSTGADAELITAVTSAGMIPAIMTTIRAVTFRIMTITTTCLATTPFIPKVIGTIARR
jgi:hypothetical protein